MKSTVSTRDINAIAHGNHRDPFTVLGMHEVPYRQSHAIAVRAFLPEVEQAFVYDLKRQQRYPMTPINNDGFFEVVFSRRRKRFAYHLETIDSQGNQTCLPDVYAFPPVLAEEDLKRFQTGRHYSIYEYLGSHLWEINGVAGTVFAVWAPNAKMVSVVGDFNNWDARIHCMRLREKWGIWEIFIPGIKEGAHYQYKIKTRSGEVYTKTDPYGFHCELRLNNEVSIVANPDRFEWRDQQWMAQRRQHTPLEHPVSVYEVHLGSWMRPVEDDSIDGNQFLTYRELAETMIPYIKSMGFTYIELLPVAEHPYYPSWGYQVTGYYAPTSRYGNPEDFMYFVDECHRQGIGVIVDWVPAHFPKDEFSLGNFDGTYLYEHEDPMMAEHKDWGTLIFDYGKNEVKNFLIANAAFWFEKYHIDGIRVDAVASMLYLDYSRQEGEWEPNEYGGRENLEAIAFLKDLNAFVHDRFPGVMTIAEESTSWLGVTYPAYLGGLDFTFKWNLGWMNDMLHYLSHDPFDRKFVHTMVPFALLYAFHEHFMLELSHDEVVHGKGSLLAKMPGDEEQKFANLRVLYGFMFGHPGKKLLFMGNEFGQWNEWNHDRGLQWDLLQYPLHQGLQKYVRDLNYLYASEQALYADDLRERGFAWIDYQDFQHSIISFMRKTEGKNPEFLIFVCNFTPVARYDYRVGVPLPGYYVEIINSDSEKYGGTGEGNPEACQAEPSPWQRQPYSIRLTLPPLSALIIKPVPKFPEQVGAEEVQTGKERPSRLLPDLSYCLMPAELRKQKPPETGIPGSRIARPQGSRPAILAEDSTIIEEKKSSG